jgi:G3E family GTPase
METGLGSSSRPIPVTVIGGFLGAGKTSLLNGILEQAESRRIAVLVNDFGTLCVDASLVSARSARTISLANGCICCTLVDGLAQALLDVLELDPPPDHLLVEASGVSDPSRIAQLARGDRALGDAGTLVLVAADQIGMLARDRYVGDTVLRQLAAADLMLLNKVDLVTEAEAGVVAAWLREQAPRAGIIRTVNARLPCDIVLGPGARADDRGDRLRYRHRAFSAGDDAPATFSTETLRCSRALSERRLREALDALPDTVLRAKGYVRFDTAPGNWQVVQAVGRRWSLAAAPATVSSDESMLVLIGAAGAMRLDDSVPIVRLFGRA